MGLHPCKYEFSFVWYHLPHSFSKRSCKLNRSTWMIRFNQWTQKIPMAHGIDLGDSVDDHNSVAGYVQNVQRFLGSQQKTKGVTAEQNNASGSAQTHHHNWQEAMLVLSKLVFSLTHRTWQGFGSACKLICFSHNLLTVWNPGTLIWRPERSHISELVGHCQANVRDVAVFSGFGHGKQNLQQNAKCKQVGENPKKQTTTSSFRLFVL